jgi:hypothetical protein
MFENFINDVKNAKKQPENLNINFSDNPAINIELFKEKMQSLDSISDRDLFDLVKYSYQTILEDIFINNNARLALDIFTHPRFIMTLNQVLLNNIQLTHSQKVYCNKLAYDYLTLRENKDQYVKQLLFTLSKTVNKDVIPGLLGIELPEELAAFLALSRYSSEKESVNVKRVNFIIVTSSIQLMTEQRIIWIYEKLFNNLTPLVEGIMFDVYEEAEFNDNEEAREIYSIINLAILDILNSAPIDVIRKILMSYAGDFSTLYAGNKSVRFNMNALSEDYARITHVVECLKAENIYVP